MIDTHAPGIQSHTFPLAAHRRRNGGGGGGDNGDVDVVAPNKNSSFDDMHV